jgi:hypothetical protein
MMKRLLFGILTCMTANMYSMAKMEKAPQPRRSRKLHLSKYAVQQQWNILGMEWVRTACEDRCENATNRLHSATHTLNTLSTHLFLYKRDAEYCGMPQRHINKMHGIESAVARLQECIEREAKYLEKFREKNKEMLARLLARKNAIQKKN